MTTATLRVIQNVSAGRGRYHGDNPQKFRNYVLI